MALAQQSKDLASLVLTSVLPQPSATPHCSSIILQRCLFHPCLPPEPVTHHPSCLGALLGFWAGSQHTPLLLLMISTPCSTSSCTTSGLCLSSLFFCGATWVGRCLSCSLCPSCQPNTCHTGYLRKEWSPGQKLIKAKQQINKTKT